MKNNSFIIKGSIHNLRSIFADAIELGLEVSPTPFHDPFRRSNIRCLVGENFEPLAGFESIPDRNFAFEFVLPDEYSDCYIFLNKLAKIQ